MKFILKRAVHLLVHGGINIHLSQYGEDIFLHKKFRKMTRPGFYVDVGAHHPFRLSNTAYLWAMGWNGLNVDASQYTIKLFNQYRPGDINICKAVVGQNYSNSNESVIFYYSDEVDNCASCDPEIARARGLKNNSSVPCTTLNSLIKLASESFRGEFDLLNIDIESLDDEVIKSMDKWVIKPKILMIEIYGRTVHEVAQNPTCQEILSCGYLFTERIGHTAIFIRT
jgi:hypothetical protein